MSRKVMEQTKNLLSETATWTTYAEFMDAEGKITKEKGESAILVGEKEIINKSWAGTGGKKITNDYRITPVAAHAYRYESVNPALGIQKGMFHIDRNRLYSKFHIEDSLLSGFEIITRNGDSCHAYGALYQGNELVNTWYAVMEKQGEALSPEARKKLSEMTDEERRQLFPVLLEDSRPQWQEEYREEKAKLERIVGQKYISRMNHIGSTAVPGLTAKPTIDILLEIQRETPVSELVSRLEQAGYLCSPQPKNPAPHLMFLKGYTPQGFRGQAFHLHVRYSGDWNELYFRDYLQKHPDVAARYGLIKRKLKQVFEHDRDGYTQAKTGFILEHTEQARKEMPQKYDPE